MKKSAFFICISILFSLLIISAAWPQEDMVAISADAFNNPQRPPAIFRHDEHNESAGIEECSECHHVYNETGKLLKDESSEDQRCSDCHESESAGRKLSLMKAFHTKCKGCHQKNKNGPLMCCQCHVRRPENKE